MLLIGKRKSTNVDLVKAEISSAESSSDEGPQMMRYSFSKCESLDSPVSSETSKIPNKSVALSAQEIFVTDQGINFVGPSELTGLIEAIIFPRGT